MKTRVMLMRPDGGAGGGSAVADPPDTAAADAAAKAAADKATSDAAAAEKAASDKAVADKAAADKATADAAAAKAALKYDGLQLPKDSTLDPALLERTGAIARDLGLPDTAAAQKLVDLVHQEVATREAALLADHQPGGTAWSQQLDAWKAETLADPSLGKTPEERTAAIQRGAAIIDKFEKANPDMGKAMKAFLNTSGLGERREVAHFFAWLGRSAGEKPLIVPGGGGGGGDSAVAKTYQEKSGMNP
jgi:hypothetical protein